jgi:hypothetical protein
MIWKTSFYKEGLPLISLLAGLTEILYLQWDDTHQLLHCFVRVKDPTNTIFRDGVLLGKRVSNFELKPNVDLVECYLSN